MVSRNSFQMIVINQKTISGISCYLLTLFSFSLVSFFHFMDAVLSFVENVVKPISHINNDAICITFQIFSLEEKLVNLFFWNWQRRWSFFTATNADKSRNLINIFQAPHLYEEYMTLRCVGRKLFVIGCFLHYSGRSHLSMSVQGQLFSSIIIFSSESAIQPVK